jgi:hypothetical protein
MDAQTEPQSPISPDRARLDGAIPPGWNSRIADRLLGLAPDDVTWVTETDEMSLAVQTGVVPAP